MLRTPARRVRSPGFTIAAMTAAHTPVHSTPRQAFLGGLLLAIIGAIFGHILLDLTPSYLSVFGMLALAGIAVNDTLVMVDFINRRCAAGNSLLEAVAESGTNRFRPIFLTSVTTFVGLMPLIFDPSIQAKFLIPMAVSLAFGVLFATGVTLFLVPCAVLAGEDLSRACRSFSAWYTKPFKSPMTTADRQS